LKDFTCQLNVIKWQYTRHTLDNIKWRLYNIQDILLYIKALQLDYNDIFEYYASDNGTISKACYRVNYKGLFDLILVISSEKNIVTIYVNSQGDNHETLDKGIYRQGKK